MRIDDTKEAKTQLATIWCDCRLSFVLMWPVAHRLCAFPSFSFPTASLVGSLFGCGATR